MPAKRGGDREQVPEEGRRGMNNAEAYYLSVLTLTVMWSALSAAMLIGSAHEVNRGSAWFWAASFVASSLGAAYCFGKLLSGGGAA